MTPKNPRYCEERGYHGPFIRTEHYAAMPGWEDYGDCVECGSCRHIPTETTRRDLVRVDLLKVDT